MKKDILEVVVDRDNEKWPGVFEHILIILHQAYDDYEKKNWLSMFVKKENDMLNFSLEISKIWNKIRFFIVSPRKYTNFLKNQIYAHYNSVEIYEVDDYLADIPDEKVLVGEVAQAKHFLYPIKTFTELQTEWQKDMVDPYSSITSALWRTGNYTLNAIQINFAPLQNKDWKIGSDKIVAILTSNYPSFIKKILLHPQLKYFKIVVYPLIMILKLITLFIKKPEETSSQNIETSDNDDEQASNKETVEVNNKTLDMPEKFVSKISHPGYQISMNILHVGDDILEWKMAIKEVASTLGVFTHFGGNTFRLQNIAHSSSYHSSIKYRTINSANTMIVNSQELSWLVHLPTNYVKTPQINWVEARSLQPPSNLPLLDSQTDKNTELTPVWITNFRGTNLEFWLWTSDRRRHMYIIGKTWMWKSTLLENMIIDDMRKGRWVAVIDPHGDLAEAVIGFIPKSRTNQTIIFDPSDRESPIAFNMLDGVTPEQRPLVASWLVGIFKKIFWESWGPRLEHILRNTILALLEYPNTTLISIPLMLTNEVFRSKVVNKITDPVVKNFWKQEFAKMAPNQKTEAAWPILNKVGQFLSSTILRNILGQSKNSFDMRWAMDNKKIIIINLSKWKIWEDASALLGSMMVTKFQMDAMSRADIPESKRTDFYLYVDEFQNFATDSFATILSEARKYKLNLVMANQYVDQMSEEVRGAVFGNVGSLVSFQVGHNDANILKEVYSGDILEDDLMQMKKYNIYTKLLVDGMPTTTFSAATYPPHQKNEALFESRYQKILQVSREKYSKPREKVESTMNRMLQKIEQENDVWEKKKQDYKKSKK